MLIEMKSPYKNESVETEVARMNCENILNSVFLKYNISATDCSIIADAVDGYVRNIVIDCQN